MPITSFDVDFDIDLSQPRRPWFMWLAWGCGGALVGQFAAWWMLQRGAGAFSGTLLFTLCGLAGILHPVFQRNAKEIWNGKLSAWRANYHLLRDLSCLFIGVMAGYALALAVSGPGAYQHVFPDAGRQVDLRRLGLGNLDWGASGEILWHNLRVLATFFLVGLIFRYVGVLFIVIFNGAHWGTAVAALIVNQQLGWPASLGLLAITMPHLILEVLAYVLAGMSGIFVMRGVSKYHLTSRHFSAIATAALELSAVGIAFLLVAAATEGISGQLLARIFADRQLVMMP